MVLKKTSKDLFLTANDISEITGMSAQYAYRLIKQLNEECHQWQSKQKVL